MPSPDRPARTFPIGAHVRGSLISAGVRVAIVFLSTLNQAEPFQWSWAAYCALMCLFAYAFCSHVAARTLAADLVAGAFYVFFRRPAGGLGVVVADVAGKGMGASLIMATVKAALPFIAAERSVAETLREATRRIAPRLEAREFVA